MSISTAPQQGPSEADVFQEMYFPTGSSNVSCYIASQLYFSEQKSIILQEFSCSNISIADIQ